MPAWQNKSLFKQMKLAKFFSSSKLFLFQLVKLHSLKVKAPTDKGPKTVKLFINQPRTLDFDQAAGNSSVQELE